MSIYFFPNLAGLCLCKGHSKKIRVKSGLHLTKTSWQPVLCSCFSILSSWTFSQSGLASLSLYPMEPQSSFGWEAPLKPLCPNPLKWAGTSWPTHLPLFIPRSISSCRFGVWTGAMGRARRSGGMQQWKLASRFFCPCPVPPDRAASSREGQITALGAWEASAGLYGPFK